MTVRNGNGLACISSSILGEAYRTHFGEIVGSDDRKPLLQPASVEITTMNPAVRQQDMLLLRYIFNVATACASLFLTHTKQMRKRLLFQFPPVRVEYPHV